MSLLNTHIPSTDENIYNCDNIMFINIRLYFECTFNNLNCTINSNITYFKPPGTYLSYNAKVNVKINKV